MTVVTDYTSLTDKQVRSFSFLNPFLLDILFLCIKTLFKIFKISFIRILGIHLNLYLHLHHLSHLHLNHLHQVMDAVVADYLSSVAPAIAAKFKVNFMPYLNLNSALP